MLVFMMLETMKKHMKIVKTCNLYLSFFTLGMLMSLMGPCLLDLQHMVRTDTRHIALIYTARSIGYLAGAIFGGILLDIVRSKQSVLMGCNLFATVSMFGIPWSRNVETLMGFMVVNGFSLGAIETGANVVCLQLWGKSSGPFFQALHFSFGLGGLVSPLIAAPYLENSIEVSSLVDNSTFLELPSNFSTVASSFYNASWDRSSNFFTVTSSLYNASWERSPSFSTVVTSSFYNASREGTAVPKLVYPFAYIGVVGVLVTVLFVIVCVVSPTEEQEDEEEPRSDQDGKSRRRSSSSFVFSVVLLTFLTVFVAIGTEIGFSQTLTAYAVKGGPRATVAEGSYMTSAFWGAFTASRLATVFLSVKIESLPLVVTDICVVGASGLVLLVLLPHKWALWLASVLFGVGIGPFYALIVAWVSNYIDVTNKVSAVATVGCAAGEMVGPFIITYFMDTMPDMFIYVTVACFVIVSVLICVLYGIFKNSERAEKGDENTECCVVNSSLKELKSCDMNAENVV